MESGNVSGVSVSQNERSCVDAILNDELIGNVNTNDFDKDGVPMQFHCFARRIHNDQNPTVTSALAGPDKEQWEGAVVDEVQNNLLKSGDVCLQPVDQCPIGLSVTYLTFVLKKKVKPNRVDRYKARGCGRGDLMKKAMSVETYSPTVSSITCAALQQLAVIDEMHEALVDTVGAFLSQSYPDNLPPIYVKLERRVAELCKLDPGQVYRVVKYLYGIPDAGRAYYKAYSGLLVAKGYQQSKYDPCLFHKTSSEGVVYAWIHVDDTWVAASSDALLKSFVKDVETKFEVTVEPVDNYLGVHYQKLEDGSVQKTQPKLLEDLFEKHHIVNRPLVKTPGLVASGGPRDSTPFDSTTFLCLLGSLLYVLCSRPDIGFAVSWAATKANTPTVSDWKDLLRCLQYLYQTREKGLIIYKQPKGCPLQMYIYVDASYLLYPDSKAQTGYSFSINDIGTFHSKSQKQPIVTTSSTHSEMRAMFVAVCQYVFLMHLFEEIGRPFINPAVACEDNQPVVTLLKRERAMPKQCKHFMMLVNYVRELVQQGVVDIRKVWTYDNYADIFTKHVQGRDFQYKRQKVLGRQEGEPLLEPVVPVKKVAQDDSPVVPSA